MYEKVRLNDRAQVRISFGGVSDARGKTTLFSPPGVKWANLDYLLGSQASNQGLIWPLELNLAIRAESGHLGLNTRN